jgi:hypothetical protein
MVASCWLSLVIQGAFFVNLAAQDLSVRASVSETTIGVEETLTYTLEVSGQSIPEIPSPSAPETDGLVLTNRFPFTSQNMSITNGRVQQSIGFSWTYKPVREGTARFESVEIEIGGKAYRASGINVTVVAQAQRPPRAQRRNPFQIDPFGRQQPPPREDAQISDRDMFIRASPSKRQAYQNEQITIEYALFFRAGIQLRQSRLADSWDAEGFWREELEIESRPIPKTVVVDGLRYNTIILKRVAVFPTRTGELRIDPLRIESEASLPFGSGDPFFSLRNRYEPVQLASPAITIDVRPWPGNPPTSFAGAVGNFTIDANVDRTRLDVGESVQVTARIRGSGNIATLAAPAFRPPGVFEAYDPEIATSVDRSGSSVRGMKTFSYVLVPRANGNFEIPGIDFSFLEPSSGEYRTIRSDPAPIVVTGTAGVAAIVATTSSGLPIDDIAPLKLDNVVWTAAGRTPIHRQPWAYVFGALPLLSLLGIALWQRHTTKLATDLKFARNRRAHPLARKHLKRAEQLLADDDFAAFYEETERAVLGFVGNRLNIAEIGLTRNQLMMRLGAVGIPDGTLSALTALLEECDRARFAPSAPAGMTPEDAHTTAASLIVSIDQSVANHRAVST